MGTFVACNLYIDLSGLNILLFAQQNRVLGGKLIKWKRHNLSTIFKDPLQTLGYHAKPPWEGELKFVEMVQATRPRQPLCPSMIKTFKNLLQKSEDL